MTTMADVAAAAGVSMSTVSHVVNRTRRVSPSAHAAVTAAIDATGYVPNSLARSLRTSTTGTIGVAVSLVSNYYLGDLIRDLEMSASDLGLSVMIADTHDTADAELAAVRALHSRRVDGVILAPCEDSDRTLEYVRSRRLPTVLLDRLADERFDQVGTENVDTVARLTSHLAAAGHRRIAFLNPWRGLATSRERLAGYILALERSGLGHDPSLVVAESSPDRAAGSIAGLLEGERAPTAVVSGNNQMTIALMRAVREHALRVPADIAVAAFDDFEWADLFEPRLTAAAQAFPAIAHLAVEMLAARIADPRRAPRTVRLPTTIHHRDSCGCGRSHEGV